MLRGVTVLKDGLFIPLHEHKKRCGVVFLVADGKRMGACLCSLFVSEPPRTRGKNLIPHFLSSSPEFLIETIPNQESKHGPYLSFGC